jgi:predicted TIM-barrel fold metal-dependent hydrolase
MPVIDVDSHFMEPFNWLEQAFPELARRVPEPDMVEILGEALFADLLANTPPKFRPSVRDIIPESFLPVLDALTSMKVGEVAAMMSGGDLGALTGAMSALGAANGDDRIAYLDTVGTDIQFVVPGATVYYSTAIRAGEHALAREVLAANNTWTADTIGPHTDRLIPVTRVDLDDLDGALAELARMRQRGSRVFQVKGEPVAGRSLAHPDFDRLWATAEDLGMVFLLHAGGGRALFDPGWFNDGRPLAQLAPLGSSQLHQMAEVTLAALIFGGVFERHPRLSVVVAELGIGWLPWFVQRIDAFLVDEVLAWLQGEQYALPLKPSEYARRHIRVSPLPLTSQPPLAVLEQVGDMLVFSSDYPHPEGTAEGPAHYRPLIAGVDADLQASFFGGSMQEVLDRAAGLVSV